jgi:hypothetical protein
MGNKVKKVKGTEKLDELKKKQAVLKARIEQMEAKAKTQERKQDVRRKILLGAFILEEAKKEGKVDELYQKMDGFLVRNSDRVLFNLPPTEKAEEEAKGENSKKTKQQ